MTQTQIWVLNSSLGIKIALQQGTQTNYPFCVAGGRRGNYASLSSTQIEAAREAGPRHGAAAAAKWARGGARPTTARRGAAGASGSRQRRPERRRGEPRRGAAARRGAADDDDGGEAGSRRRSGERSEAGPSRRSTGGLRPAGTARRRSRPQLGRRRSNLVASSRLSPSNARNTRRRRWWRRTRPDPQWGDGARHRR